MKNFEKYIDEIAELISCDPNCEICPCNDECRDADDYDYCTDFFKDWAMKESKHAKRKMKGGTKIEDRKNHASPDQVHA